jgi:hypothetical protein
MTNKSGSTQSKKEDAIKTSYHSPRFSIYGSIRDLTKTLVTRGTPMAASA